MKNELFKQFNSLLGVNRLVFEQAAPAEGPKDVKAAPKAAPAGTDPDKPADKILEKSVSVLARATAD